MAGVRYRRTIARAARRILVVDDDPDMRLLAAWALEAAGYLVATAGSVAEARSWMDRNGLPHLAVFDILLPGGSGLDFAAELHRYCDLPIILLTNVDDSAVAARSLDAVAEDYVRKPFAAEELAARIGRVLRRIHDFSYADMPRSSIAPGLDVDYVHQVAWVDSRPRNLTQTESKLIFVLAVNSPRTVSSRQLLERIWPRGDVFEDSLRVHVHRLRTKLEPDPASPRYFVTVRGVGYRLGSEDS